MSVSFVPILPLKILNIEIIFFQINLIISVIMLLKVERGLFALDEIMTSRVNKHKVHY